MSKLQSPIHSRSHNLGGSDPATIGTAPASLMGYIIGASRLTNGLGIYMGTIYLPDRDSSLPLLSGETITVDYSHYDPPDHFDWMAARAHIITGLRVDTYSYVHPWESDPFSSGVGAPSETGGTWTGLVGIAAVTNDDGETVTWTLPDVGATAEQYSFDDTGVGHIGYILHNFGATPVSGNITVAYSGASTERAGSIVSTNSDDPGSVTVGDMVGETTFTGPGVTRDVTITLTEDVPAGSQLLIVSASKGPAGFDPPDAGNRPQVHVRLPSGNFVPKYRVAGQQHMLAEQALAGTALGSAAPSGSAGGDLTGTYPNPTIDANKVTEGKIGLSDVTTDNASTSKHGFLKKLDNNSAHFMDGTGSWSTPSGSGGVASDTIWDAKGDLAAGTGADTASKLTVGSNDQVLIADSSQTTGLRWGGIDGGGA